MNTLTPSEFILNPDGSIYHLNLKPCDIADTVILVGDPDRVSVVSKYFDRIVLKKKKREFCTHTGVIGNKQITVISTGIGEDNIDIVLTELDALANIDFETRSVKKTFKKLRIIRLGTCGGLLAATPLDSVVISTYGIGFGGLLSYYDWQPNHKELTLQKSCQTEFSPLSLASTLFVASGSDALITQYQSVGVKGITLTCNGFYGAQRRFIRAPLINVDLFALAKQVAFDGYSILNMEMETAAIYGLSRLLGHEACSFSVVVANRELQTFSSDPDRAIDKMIETILVNLISSSCPSPSGEGTVG